MILRVHLSGSTIFETTAQTIPPIGSIIRLKTSGYKKGLRSGSIITIRVTNEQPPELDYCDGDELVVILDANGYEVVQEGPEIND